MPPRKQSTLAKFFVGVEEMLKKKRKAEAQKRYKIDEDTYKETQLREHLPYVPNGIRDKFGNAREKVGGRPRKADRDKAGVAGDAISKVKKNEDKKSQENDVEFYYEMQQARKKDTERLKNDKTFWEFVKEGEDAMQIPEKEKIAASSFEKQKDFNNDEGFKRGIARNKLIPY